MVIPRVIRDREVLFRDSVDLTGSTEFDGMICPYGKCGRVFSKPVRLTDLSHKPFQQTYYACPYCFSKLNLDLVGGELRSFDGASAGNTEETIASSSKNSGETGYGSFTCPYYVGYLKKREPKSTIPDGCLVCPKILQCIV